MLRLSLGSVLTILLLAATMAVLPTGPARYTPAGSVHACDWDFFDEDYSGGTCGVSVDSETVECIAGAGCDPCVVKGQVCLTSISGCRTRAVFNGSPGAWTQQQNFNIYEYISCGTGFTWSVQVDCDSDGTPDCTPYTVGGTCEVCG